MKNKVVSGWWLVDGQKFVKLRAFRFSFFVFHFSFFTTLLFNQGLAQRCGTMQKDSIMAVKYKNWVMQRKALNDSVSNFLKNPHRSARISAVCVPVKIPVVVHVVHNNATGTIGGAGNPNVSNATILNQIRVLNEDYRRKVGTKGFNNNAVGADTGIEFFLANTDPNGQPTNGITRHLYTNKTSFDIFNDDGILADIVSWPTDRYLNIWVVRSSSQATIGVAQFPYAKDFLGLDLDNEFFDKTDGVIIDFRVFGTGESATNKYYNLGRTATHEIGHWLGLLHTWGDTKCGDDFCNDTPRCENGNNTTNCGPAFSNCTGTRTRNMTENYMDYSPDSCMNIFTANQAQRMLAVMEVSPRRAKLLQRACSQLAFGQNLSIEVYPNPTANDLNVKVILKQTGNVEMMLYAATGQLVQTYFYENYPSWVFTLPTQNLAVGEYILKVKTADGNYIQRVLVNR